MTMAEDLDKLLTELGFKKILDLTPDKLNRDVTEKCDQTEGNGGCSASVSGEYAIVDVGSYPMMGALALYMLFDWTADYQPRDVLGVCNTSIEIYGETEIGKIKLIDIHFDECVYEV